MHKFNVITVGVSSSRFRVEMPFFLFVPNNDINLRIICGCEVFLSD